MKTFYTVALAALCLDSLQAADIDNGDDLHFSNCTGCHDESVYTGTTGMSVVSSDSGRRFDFARTPWDYPGSTTRSKM